MTTKKQETQDNGTAGTDGKESEQRTFSAEEVTEIVRRRLAQQERKHAEEIEQLRKTLTANIERNQHLQHDNERASKLMEELEELREYKSQRERNDLLQHVSSEYGGIPIDLLQGETEEELCAVAERIRAYADTFKPRVPELNAAGATPSPDGINSILKEKDRRERIRKLAKHYDQSGTE